MLAEEEREEKTSGVLGGAGDGVGATTSKPNVFFS